MTCSIDRVTIAIFALGVGELLAEMVTDGRKPDPRVRLCRHLV